MATPDSITKKCNRCKDFHPLTEFYPRSNQKDPLNPSQYTGECKTCMKARNKTAKKIDNLTPYSASERLCIDHLHSFGIPTLPGKALSHSWVDLIAYGCVRIEVKYSTLIKGEFFKFTFSPEQKRRGLLGDVIALICDYGTRQTFHFFLPTHPAFYINGELKTGFHFTPGAMTAKKFGKTRTVMTQPIMDSGLDNIHIINRAFAAHCKQLRATAILKVA